ncbi:hypothetical protein [Methanoregula sp.]|uniref:COG1470 family protein n=1 Tax=Methanoregula sp. TaxID=2052170 RepID=UPI000CBB8B57|nr:hypothetical protein [Methanoregula sp.]PKG33359.1 MAG: hypothetical protein CW742_03380 [Methanoregula sp.]
MRPFSISIIITAAVLLFLAPAACAADDQTGNSGASMQVVTAIPLPVPTPGTIASPVGNYTKLEINPTYTQFALKPGESKDMTITVRNRDSKTVTLTPKIKLQPYNIPYELDPSWIAVSPASADVPAGESIKFTMKVSTPADASRGPYNANLVFTDEEYPAAYPTPYPNYIHQMNFYVNIIVPPVVQISPLYISDQVEAGKEYRYTVEIKNTGASSVQLAPKISSDSFMSYGLYGVTEPGLTSDSFQLIAPSSIPPGSTGTLEIIMKVPPAATGYSNGYIDLGIDDPSLMQGEGRVSLNFNIWKQPAVSYVKQFTLDAAEPVSIELTSGYSGYPAPIATSTIREPSFETTITGPGGIVTARPVQKIIRGSVNLDGDPMTASLSKEAAYHETSVQYTVIYAVEGKPGVWQLSVTPKNTQNFEYKITLGNPNTGIPSLNLFSSTAAVSMSTAA